jgi:phage shock protein A
MHRFFGLSAKGWVDALFKPAEDPRQAFTRPDQSPGKLLEAIRQALAAASASRISLEGRAAQLAAKLRTLEGQAREALVAGREDLARLALQRRQAIEEALRALERQAATVQREEHRLALVEQQLMSQIEQLQTRRQVLAAEYTAAEAQVRIQEALSGVSRELADVGNTLQQAEEEAARLQARSAAINDLIATGVLEVPGVPAPGTVEREIAQVEGERAVEDRLARLKREVDGR